MTQVQRDRRQEILDRLYTQLAGLTINLAGGPDGAVSIAAGNIVRNRNDLQADKLPGMIVLDADEVKDSMLKLPPGGGNQQRMPAQLMRMTPEIYVVLDTRPVGNKNTGKDLNTARLAILDTIWSDSVLWGIVGTNGNITYDGCVTDLARNRTAKGQIGLSVTFTYPLLVREYVTG